MALNFKGYGEDPGVEIRRRWSGSIDGIFDAYMNEKNSQKQEQRQSLADSYAAQDRSNAAQDRRMNYADKFGVDIGARATPPQIGTPSDRSSVIGAPESRPSEIVGGPENRQAQTPSEPFNFGNHVQSYISRRNQERSLSTRKTESDIANTEADTRKKNADAEAYGREQIFIDPSSGRRITVPKGAKLMPAASGGDGKILPASNVVSLNEGQAVSRMLPEVEDALKQNEALFGPVTGRMGAANPYNTQSQTVDAKFRTAAQAFGRFMEGGVLRKEDEEKYRKMFPQLSDTPELAKNKLSIVRRQLAQKYESDRGALGGAGYNIGGAGKLDVPPSIFPQQGGGDPSSIVKAGLAAGKSREQIKSDLKAAGH